MACNRNGLTVAILSAALLFASTPKGFSQEKPDMPAIIVKLNDPELQKRVGMAVQKAAFEELSKEGIELSPEVIAALAEMAAKKEPADTLAAGAVFIATVAMFSDIRLKENIVKVGERADGIHLYEFSYLGQTGRWRGLIAQDVLEHRPEAVAVGPGGYYVVNYRALAAELRPAH